MRLLVGHSALPPPAGQFTIVDGRRFVARVDFAWPDRKVALEYDGLWHADRRAFLDDRRRLNRLTSAGWLVVHVTVDDLRHPERLLPRIHALHAQRLVRANTR